MGIGGSVVAIVVPVASAELASGDSSEQAASIDIVKRNVVR
jgi:hypothetical protein